MTRKKTIRSLGLSLVVIAILTGFVLPQLSRTNCGGNSAALANCKQILATAQLSGAASPLFLMATQMRLAEREQFLKLGANSWTGNARFWVRTNGLDLTVATQVVVFCDQTFDNVPQPALRNFFKRHPAHAAGFADGTTGLMPPEADTQLDRTDFAPIAYLQEIHQP
ncbi:MAG TPA: hypothetical protein PKN95_10235 [Verrucomicrobiota bacterium]|nr:hypothetical protein [Verrucomicrobiota bacterium]HNT15484.1 hypothetical protein [Verrucomicrobiota bacterium]